MKKDGSGRAGEMKRGRLEGESVRRGERGQATSGVKIYTVLPSLRIGESNNRLQISRDVL